jgi:hypothetical protein
MMEKEWSLVNQEQSSATIGTVVSLWRYPVKSMMG